MGLTGASFICYNHKPKNKVNSFVLNIQNLAEKNDRSISYNSVNARSFKKI